MKLLPSTVATWALLLPLAAAAAASHASSSASSRRSAKQCHALPGDSCWPSASAWRNLNTTVNGRLVASSPLGSPCHDPNFDQDACTALQGQWLLPQVHLPSSSSVMQAFFANQSCDPFTPREWPCVLGNYVSYAVNVSETAHVAEALKFAQHNNIRVVVRNTGHDFFGRSTGAGALAIWVHGLTDIEVLDWADGNYKGRALKSGAGVIGSGAVEAVDPHGLVVVTGECPTVGLAGGFSQGGGHSALSTNFGLAADQVLEYEVVTADGKVVKASATQNSDLYWALSGGGGGTFGVVTSITVRAHPAGQVGGGTISLSVAYTTQAAFDEAVSKFHSFLPAIIDHGASLSYAVSNQIFSVTSVTMLNSTGDYVRDTVMAPFIAALKALAIPSSSSFTTLSYRDHYNTYMGPLPFGHIEVEAYQFGGRLIPRTVIEKDNDVFQTVLRNLTANGVLAVGSVSSYAGHPGGPNNSVLPAWRDALIQLQLTTPWDPTAWEKMLADQKRITNEFVPQLVAITPGSGAYMNEADFNEPQWKDSFFGANYGKLMSIKAKWDPQGVFYVLKGVGSDAWTVAEDGRMCRA